MIVEPDESAVKLEELINYSKKMLDAARSDSWSVVVSIETNRGKAMRAFFEENHNRNLPTEVLRQGLKKLNETEVELVALGLAAKKKLGDNIQELGRSRQAVAAYGEHEHA